MYLLGYDIGSSSVKVSLLEASTGQCIASAFEPGIEAPIISVKPGWAEQEPESWWLYLKHATQKIIASNPNECNNIKAIGISYQMHGLVIVDEQKKVLRPAIIWCDSRAVKIGQKAFEKIGEQHCLSHLLNSPGNFTASKLRWVKENEPDLFDKIYKIMLPGDYIAMKLTGEIKTTVSGLSEGIFWNFKTNSISGSILGYYDIPTDFILEIVPTFGEQGYLTRSAAEEIGLPHGIPISYRAGDQPNNAFSLNVLNPGEVAATAGTSGVVYGVSDSVKFDPQSRVNTFAHVNHSEKQVRLGVLLCVNGTGILNSWMHKNIGQEISYNGMNEMASEVPVGSEGLSILPFGNGAERILGNRDISSLISGLKFNVHKRAHMFRAAQEGIAFAMNYGMEIMKETGINLKVIRAGHANLFLSPVFREALAGVTGASIELYNTDGSQGAARAAGVGAGIYHSPEEAFGGLNRINTVEPSAQTNGLYAEAYNLWKEQLDKQLK